MKIISLNSASNSLGTGGAERTMETLLRAFKSRGHDVAVLGTGPERGLHRHDDGDLTQWRAGISNIYWPRMETARPAFLRRLWHMIDIYNIAMRRPLEAVLDRVQPDLVFLHNLPGWSIAAVAAIRARRIPMIQILHDHYNICVNSAMRRGAKNCRRQCVECRIMRAPHRAITRHVDAVVGVSDYILQRHLAHGAYAGVAERRVVRNARDETMLGVGLVETPRAAVAGRLHFGFIGSLTAAKGIEYLLQTFARWDEPGATLLVAGTGTAEFTAALKTKFSSPRIVFLGQVAPKAFFPMIDVAIVPSLWQEPLAMVVAESFAFGVPVIAARRGGLPEMVRDGETGFIFEPDEAGALLAAMRRFTAAPGLAGELGTKARAAAAPYLDVASWQRNYEHLAQTIIAARRGAKAVP